jgi:hypothetical protein
MGDAGCGHAGALIAAYTEGAHGSKDGGAYAAAWVQHAMGLKNRRDAQTRGEAAIAWIEKFCLVPSGPNRGKRIALETHSLSRLRLPERPALGGRDRTTARQFSCVVTCLRS